MTKARDLASIPAGSGDFSVGGGIYLGGATAANYLDDYEEGTWTPVELNDSIAITFTDANYVKVGNVLIAYARIIFPTNTGSNQARIGGLPYNKIATSAYGWGGFINYCDANINLTCLAEPSSNAVRFYDQAANNINNSQFSGHNLRFSVVYQTA